MFNGLRIGVTGMSTSQKIMDNVADQIANSATAGYKKKEVRFGELLRNEITRNHVGVSPNAEGSSISAGSKAVLGKTNYLQGVLRPSDSTFHMAVEGPGFFGVMTSEGELLLTRNGAFTRTPDGMITDGDGHRLVYESYAEESAWGSPDRITIREDGTISGVDEKGAARILGKVALFHPDSNEQLISLGKGRYGLPQGMEAENSIDSEGGSGRIHQRTLEESNVDLAESMTEMILTQRAYQMNAKSITTADEMLEVINTIL